MKNHVAVFSLAAPARNAETIPRLFDQISEIEEEAASNGEIKVVVITDADEGGRGQHRVAA